MKSNVVHLPVNQKNDRRLLQRAVNAALQNCIDRRVAERWQTMAFGSIDEFPSPPTPTVSELALELDSIDAAAKQQCLDEVSDFLASYVRDVRDQQIRMHTAMWQLQRRVAELESETPTRLNL